MTDKKVTVIGAGLAGCEAAWQIARAGVSVDLVEMKPNRFSDAHHMSTFAELVCSNSLRSNQIENAVGLLKEELRRMGSLIMSCADETTVPAGGALAVDRTSFSELVTQKIHDNSLIHVINHEAKSIPENGVVIIATGPLTDKEMYQDICRILGDQTLHFFDAAAPIMTLESINRNLVFAMSRYDKGGADYLNCPMSKDEYLAFWQALIGAELADVKDFDKETVFEGCMPIETMAKRGEDTMRFGPLKPVGLIDPRTGKEPYACVQLRQDDRAASLYNLVGFQTRLKFKEQERVFRMIPGLEDADFSRYGVMHRNTYLDSPRLLTHRYSLRQDSRIYFAGQMTGVEGYIESTGSGFVCGISAAAQVLDKELPFEFTDQTMIGAMSQYISDESIKHFSPMNANFGLISSLPNRVRGKKERNLCYAKRSLDLVDGFAEKLSSFCGENV